MCRFHAPISRKRNQLTNGRSSDFILGIAAFPLFQAVAFPCAAFEQGLTASGNVADFHCVPILAHPHVKSAKARTKCAAKLRISERKNKKIRFIYYLCTEIDKTKIQTTLKNKQQ